MRGRGPEHTPGTSHRHVKPTARNPTVQGTVWVIFFLISILLSKNKSKIEELLKISAKNSEGFLENKEKITKRRQSILENRKGIEENTAKLI